LNAISTSAGFCDEREVDDWGEDPEISEENPTTLACLVSAPAKKNHITIPSFIVSPL